MAGRRCEEACDRCSGREGAAAAPVAPKAPAAKPRLLRPPRRRSKLRTGQPLRKSALPQGSAAFLLSNGQQKSGVERGRQPGPERDSGGDHSGAADREASEAGGLTGFFATTWVEAWPPSVLVGESGLDCRRGDVGDVEGGGCSAAGTATEWGTPADMNIIARPRHRRPRGPTRLSHDENSAEGGELAINVGEI